MLRTLLRQRSRLVTLGPLRNRSAYLNIEESHCRWDRALTDGRLADLVPPRFLSARTASNSGLQIYRKLGAGLLRNEQHSLKQAKVNIYRYVRHASQHAAISQDCRHAEKKDAPTASAANANYDASQASR